MVFKLLVDETDGNGPYVKVLNPHCHTHRDMCTTTGYLRYLG